MDCRGVTPGASLHKHVHGVRVSLLVHCRALAILVPMRWHHLGMSLPSLCPWPSPRLFWPSRPCPFSRHSLEAAWEKAIKLSLLTGSPFTGPGGKLFCAEKEKAGLQRSVMQDFFEREGKEMPE